MTRMSVALIAGVVVLSVALVPASPQSQNPSRPNLKPIETPPNGRYQIVNGTPEMTRNIMLLDTQTGKTWIICTGSDGATWWCTMQTGEQTGKEVSSSSRPSLSGKPSGTFEGATTVLDGLTYVSKNGKWQLP